MQFMIKVTILIFFSATSIFAYVLSSDVPSKYKISSIGTKSTGLSYSQVDTSEDNEQDEDEDDDEDEDEEIIKKYNFEPAKYHCYNPQNKSDFIFFENMIQVEHRGQENLKKFIYTGSYSVNGENASFVMYDEINKNQTKYEIILIDGTHGERFMINITDNNEIKLFCKAKKNN